jgi:4-amino-4-deoxy-L-arabinose transferase-like glycosyltransferase
MSNQRAPEKPSQAQAHAGVATHSAVASTWARVAHSLLTERGLLWMAALLLLGLYVRSIGFAPVYDDNVIGEWGKLSDIPKFFLHDIFGSDGTAHSVYYRPLAVTYGFLMSYVTGGAPGWLHLGAVLLHLAVVLLAYRFGRQLFHDERLALLTAVLFGLHPSKVESVAWIGSSCVDGLGAVFFFASLIAFLEWQERKSAGWWAGSVALFACAMLTKETMVFIPLLIAVYFLLMTPRAGRIMRTVWALWPYAVVWVVYMAVRHQVIKPAGATAEYIHPTFTLANLWTAPYSIWWYISHLVMPWGLAVEYASHVVEQPTITSFALPAAGLVVLLVAAWWLWRRQCSRVAAFLIFWFVLTLAPPVIVAPMVLQHDRYLYLACYAYCALLAWMILRLGNVQPRTRLAVALCVVALWTGLTWHEMGYWDRDEALWARVLEISPTHPGAQVRVALSYAEAGDVPKALAMMDDALRLRPNSVQLRMVRAGVLAGAKQLDEARAEYLRVLQLTEPAPGHAVEPGMPARMRAAAAYQLALMDVKALNYPEAEQYARIALALNYKGVGYHAVLADSLRGEGLADEAKAESTTELKLRLAQQQHH